MRPKSDTVESGIYARRGASHLVGRIRNSFERDCIRISFERD